MSLTNTGARTRINILVPIAKKDVDEEKRIVRGIATQEVRDSHGEIVDYESVKAVLPAYRGNIREMHQPKAVGRAVDLETDDATKAVIVDAYVSKGAPDTWEKVKDGTLSMFSIGGYGERVTNKLTDGTTETRIVMTALHEISLVDSGACPTASFDIVKMVDGQLHVSELCDADPLDDDTSLVQLAETMLVEEHRTPANIEALVLKLKTAPAVAGGGNHGEHAEHAEHGEHAEKATGSPAPAETGHRAGDMSTPTAVAKRIETYDIQSALAVIGWLQELVASESYEALYREQWGGDPPTPEDRAQLELLKGAAALVLDFLTSEFAEQFRDVPPESSVEMSADSLTGFIAKVIAQRQASTTVEKKGARHSRSDIGMLQTMHDTAVALGATCGTTTEKQVIDKGAEMKCKKCGGVLAADDVDETCAKCATKKSVDAPPAAAVAQAATEPAVPATPAEPAAAEPVAQAVLVADDHDSIVKKFSDLFSTVSKQLEELKATSETTIAELKQRIEELAEQPAPGGPVANAHAVDKTFAGAGAPAADLTDPNVARLALQVANQLGADASLTATQREALAMNVIRLQRQHGIDATIVPMPSGR